MAKWKKPKGRQRRWNKRALIQRDGNNCGVCGERISNMKDITLDHILPRCKGGLDELENLQLAHEGCNRAKADMTMEEWMEFQNG